MGWSERGNGRSYNSLNGYGSVIGLFGKILDFATRNRKYKNQLKKSFTKNLYAIQNNFNELKKKETTPHLKKCFGYAVAQNEAKTLRWLLLYAAFQIMYSISTKTVAIGVTVCSELYKKLKEIFSKYADIVFKFSVALSSQANESLNNIMAHKASKNCCYSRSDSSDYRFASAVCSRNIGATALVTVKEELILSPGKHTASYAARKDVSKLKRSIKEKLRLYRSDKIWKIAAQYENRIFNVYLNPTKDGHPDASMHTGLKNIDGKLFLPGKKLESIPSNEAFTRIPTILELFFKTLHTSFTQRCIRHFSLYSHAYHKFKVYEFQLRGWFL
ncbi:uncharacterized protein LOC124414417 [Diprion similis]|uniref:uncharacterized protein LOC124414417 n=1 Tax=Diprion similis TaxID=362088 RepID=UPI001EF89F5E|nr:uncharacterized protein LOC124414417 [Diprion similis]